MNGLFEGVGTGTVLLGFAWNADDTLATRFNDSGTANYTYDAIGRLQTQNNTFPSFSGSNVSWTFGLSPASQITQETRDNDAYAFSGIPTANKAYSVNGLNQYTAVAGTGHTYDANGNLTGDGTTAYIYDGENRLVSATAAGVTTTLTYDPLGRLWRVEKGASDTRFLTDGDAIVAEYDGSAVLTNRYVHGSNVAADDPLLWYVGSGTGTKRYLHADHLGSIVAATNSGSAPTINAYDEYGVPKSGNVGRFQYTGQIWLSELGLYHYKARLYSPTLGRFLQTDPVGYADQINLYAYVADDPINSSDPSGLASCGSRLDNNDAAGCFGMIAVEGGTKARPKQQQTTKGNAGAQKKAPQARPWTSRDFVRHYYSGGGRSVNLRDVGLAERFRNHPSVRAAVNEFRHNMSIVRPGDFPNFSFNTKSGTDVTDTIFSVGRSTFFESAECNPTSCNLTFSIRDKFQDPVSLGFELGGTPYQINYQWTETMQRPQDDGKDE